jgi:hypothetical protein
LALYQDFPPKGHAGLVNDVPLAAFGFSFTAITLAELGDKTFF